MLSLETDVTKVMYFKFQNCDILYQMQADLAVYVCMHVIKVLKLNFIAIVIPDLNTACNNIFSINEE